MNHGFNSKSELLDYAAERGHYFEQTYHGCAQSTLAALMETFPQIRSPEAFRAASGFGGGIGVSAEGSCGALLGGAMAISLFFGRELEAFDDPEGKRFNSYRLARILHERFITEYHTALCKEIQTQVIGQAYRLHIPEEFDAFIEAGGHKDKCPGVVGRAARWTAKILLEESETTGSLKNI